MAIQFIEVVHSLIVTIISMLYYTFYAYYNKKMRGNILMIILCFLAFKMQSSEPKYEIKALEGTYVFCSISKTTTYPSICSAIILDSDSTLLKLDNDLNFFQSLLKKAEFVQDGELFYAQAYNLIFPYADDLHNNYELAQDLRMNFNYLFELNQKVEEFKLSTDEKIEISYCKVKGIFLSTYDEDRSNLFCTSLDVSKTLLPPNMPVNIPLVIFECSESNHKFYIKM